MKGSSARSVEPERPRGKGLARTVGTKRMEGGSISTSLDRWFAQDSRFISVSIMQVKNEGSQLGRFREQPTPRSATTLCLSGHGTQTTHDDPLHIALNN